MSKGSLEAEHERLVQELADTKAQLEYVRNTVRVQEETAQELEAERDALQRQIADMASLQEALNAEEFAQAKSDLYELRFKLERLRRVFMQNPDFAGWETIARAAMYVLDDKEQP